MPIREFELFHGAVLTKLVRSDTPLTLRMIETRSGESWSTYKINDEVRLLLKHSVISRALSRDKSRAWQFVFSPDQMIQVAAPTTWCALVCGNKSIADAKMEICLLDPSQLGVLLDITTRAQQSLMIKRIEGKSLRASSVRASDIVIARNRLDSWAVPGS